ncbi:MFS transporter [Nakamurella lactea]|uniref:MFS transporter n=1 Tax=Nakamurella lactea TaxID=459515 RepID=UPI0004215D7F|nr:MFS transporter [Nakamurella lactea]
MSTTAGEFRWRPILVPAYGPTALASLGYGALAPIVALAAIDLGAGVATAALVVGLTAFGQLIGDLPAGVIAARLGERRALLLASLVDAASMTVAYFAHSLLVLAIAVFVDGMAAAVFNLARHTWMTTAIPVRYRARALSSLGGTFRIGLFFGPFIAAGLVSAFSLHAVFLFAAGTGLAAGLLTLTMAELPMPEPRPGELSATDPVTLARVVRRHLRVLATIGVGVLLISAARASRQSILPLWSQAQQLDASTISLIFGIASGVELLLVYPGGAVMDRYGRVFVAVPAVALMGVGLGLLPLAHTAVSICLVACVMAVGNGLSSGIVLTLGSDAAPAVGRPQFLGAWRFLADTGGILGPGLIAVVAAIGTLAGAAWVLVGVCALGAGWLAAWAPRRSPVIPVSVRSTRPPQHP